MSVATTLAHSREQQDHCSTATGDVHHTYTATYTAQPFHSDLACLHLHSFTNMYDTGSTSALLRMFVGDLKNSVL